MSSPVRLGVLSQTRALVSTKPFLTVLTRNLHRRIEAYMNSSKEIITFAVKTYIDFYGTKSLLNYTACF